MVHVGNNMNNRLIARQPELCDAALAEAISNNLNLPLLAARALIRRGNASLDEARCFLEPTADQMLDPYLLPDMEQAVFRIRMAIESNESICVYGDYDADGVCSTAILTKRLMQMGAHVQFYIPQRHSEGYGMNESAVRKLKANGVSLIVTVDNGVSAFNEIALCGALGIDVVITDHHSVGKAIPDCVAVVAASRKDSTYPNRYLCGAGVALKLIQALTGGSYSNEELALAAVATIADVVPLTGENRVIAACGLAYLQSVSGLVALLNAAGFQQTKVDEQTVSFMIAPRLNAAGRMASAADAVEMLLGVEEIRENEIAQQLNLYNQRRKDAENEILAEAERQIEVEGRDGRVLLLSHLDWNPGVIGIVASRLCERMHVPVILFAEQDGVLTGSGRSIEGIDLFENLSVCSHLFLRFGGHARAAGVTIAAERFVEFKTLFMAQIESRYRPEDFYPTYVYDEAVSISELTTAQVRALKRLAPFGERNPEPVFRFNGVRFASLRTIGKDDKHFCASAVQGDHFMRLVAFGKSELMDALATATEWDLIGAPSINEYRGNENVELFWICANASEEKIAVFNAFFEQRLYNENGSNDKLTEWYSSFFRLRGFEFNDVAMRKHYRALQSALSEEPCALRALIRSLKVEELLALCVFTQLSFFMYDPETRFISQNASLQQRTLKESSLYRIVNNTEEA